MHEPSVSNAQQPAFTGFRGAIRRLYFWVLHWAHTPHGLAALFLISFAEASFFPIPPDVLLMALVLGKPSAWVRFAAVCTAGSVLGAIAGYYIGFGLWALVDQYFFQYVFSVEVFESVVQKYEANAFLTVFTAAFTPIPFKVITIAAGVAQISVAMLVLGSVLGRAGRFFLVAGLLGRFGTPMKAFIDRYFEILTLAFTVLLIGSFILLKYLV
jgi:membrane protein YqaA with SNARE-associated domain